MPFLRDAGSVEGNVEHFAMLDQFPELWIEILRLVPELDRARHVPLVCHRFSDACREPAIWSDLKLKHQFFVPEARWQSFLRWLAVRVSKLQSFALELDYTWRGRIDYDWEKRILELISLLAATAPQLQGLLYHYPDLVPGSDLGLALPAAIGQLSQLTSLSLSVGSAPVTAAQVDIMVEGLPSLQLLDLRGGQAFLADGFPVGIAVSCSQLQHLRIDAGFPGGTPPELGRLTRLTHLMLKSRCANLPASISRLTGLRSVVLSDFYGDTKLPEQLWHLESITELRLNIYIKCLSSSISRLTALQDLYIENAPDFALPLGLTACQQLSHLTIGYESSSPVLAMLPSLRYLGVKMLPSQLPHSTYWTQLTGLTQLRLNVTECHVSQYSGISGMTSLCDLRILGGSGLPEGPYLSHLQTLFLGNWEYEAGIPLPLQGATRLQMLVILPPNELNDDDVAALVTSLPAALKQMTIYQKYYSKVTAEEWNQRVSHLRAALIAEGRTPPVITMNGSVVS